jgi:hypothetical protein
MNEQPRSDITTDPSGGPEHVEGTDMAFEQPEIVSLCCGHHLVCHDRWNASGCGYLGCRCGESFASATVALVRAAQAQAWDARGCARGTYAGPDNGHAWDCAGWEDCACATYPNPYEGGQDLEVAVAGLAGLVNWMVAGQVFTGSAPNPV